MSDMRQADQAGTRAFDRAVESGKISDDEQAWVAFSIGWNSLLKYERAQASLSIYRSPLLLLGMVLAFFGSSMALSIGFLLFHHAPNLRDTAWVAVPIGLLLALTGAGFIVLGNSHDRAALAKAQAAFDAEWAYAASDEAADISDG